MRALKEEGLKTDPDTAEFAGKRADPGSVWRLFGSAGTRTAIDALSGLANDHLISSETRSSTRPVTRL